MTLVPVATRAAARTLDTCGHAARTVGLPGDRGGSDDEDTEETEARAHGDASGADAPARPGRVHRRASRPGAGEVAAPEDVGPQAC